MQEVTFTQMGLAVAILLLSIKPLLDVLNFFGLGRAQKRQLSFETEFATREALEEVRSDLQVVDGKVETLKVEIIRNGEARKTAIEAKVEAARCEARNDTAELRRELIDVGNKVAAVGAKIELINQRQLQTEARP